MENEDSKSTHQDKINEVELFEEKIRVSLVLMKEAIAASENPNFKLFWEIKNLCLNFFKENIPTNLRNEYWQEYVELSQEAKGLRDILDEQTSFAVEQIDIAITSLEQDIENYDNMLSQISEIRFPENFKALLDKKNFYINTQKELTILNSFAVRVNSLRKEIIKTNMRIGTKNKFFKRLALIGDIVFPKRKHYIKQMSEEFVESIDRFTGDFDVTKAPYYVLRDEIKNLQNLAKLFTLNTDSFTQTRLKLSEYWDKVKGAEKNYKKERQAIRQNVYLIEKKVEEFKEKCKGSIDKSEASKIEKEILSYANNLGLKKNDISKIRYLIKEAKMPLFAEENREKEEKRQKFNEEKAKAKEKVQQLKDAAEKLANNRELSIEELAQEKEALLEEIEKLNISKIENLIFEKQMSLVEDLMDDKQEESIINSGVEKLEDLKSVFENKKKKRTLIKVKLENYKKELSGSGFDFEQAIVYREIIDAEKNRLEKVNDSIEQIEEKILEIENN